MASCTTEQDLGSHARMQTEGGTTDEGGSLDASSDGGLDPSPIDTGRDFRIVFGTDNLYSGDLRTEGGASSGLEGADRVCNREAADAKLAGRFRAWLSTSTVDARDRIAPVGPWKLVDGTTIFPGSAVTGPPARYLQLTAKGQRIFASNQPEVWTATLAMGNLNRADHACADWSSGSADVSGNYGVMVSSDGEWTDAGLSSSSIPCSARARLYCFEQ